MAGQIPQRPPFSRIHLHNSTSTNTSPSTVGTQPESISPSTKRGPNRHLGCFLLLVIIAIVTFATYTISNSVQTMAIVGIVVTFLGAIAQFQKVQELIEAAALTCGYTVINLIRKRGFWVAISVLLAIVLAVPYIRPILWPSHPSAAILCGACNIYSAPDGEPIGISDGQQGAFDMAKSSDTVLLKQQRNWQQVLMKDENDAETLIYQENQAVSNKSYLNIVVATMLTKQKGSSNSASLDTGRTLLQGAFTAQKEANYSCLLQGCRQVRLLITNTGDTSRYADQVADQIIQEAHKDPNFAGVMGWPFSVSSALEAIKKLAANYIPMISPTASTDFLTGTTSASYFLRIAPTDDAQAQVAAQFARTTLNVHQVALFSDNDIPYSKTLARQFQRHWGNDDTIAVTHYARGNAISLHTALQKALSLAPDLLYFAGYPDDLQQMLQDPLLQSRLTTNQPHVMGGDGLYTLGGYSGTYRELYFTAFAYPDEWDILGMQNDQQKPKFLAEFPEDFDPQNLHDPGDYNYRRPQATTMLSYDALKTLIIGCKLALKSNSPWKLSNLQPALLSIDGSTTDKTLQGITGQIRFTSAGNVADKTVVILCVSKGTTSGFTKLVGIYNQFLVGGPKLSQTYPIKVCSE